MPKAVLLWLRDALGAMRDVVVVGVVSLFRRGSIQERVLCRSMPIGSSLHGLMLHPPSEMLYVLEKIPFLTSYSIA